MSYRTNPDQQPLRYCNNCGCVLTASDTELMCEECVEEEQNEEDDAI